MQQQPERSHDDEMSQLLRGVRRFQSGVFKSRERLFQTLSEEGQHPGVLFITCSDSRVDPTLLTQSEPGDLFVIRNAGNIVPAYDGQAASGEAASIEYAVNILNVRHIVVCGHCQCGAVAHLLADPASHAEHDGQLPLMGQWLHHAADVREIMKSRALPEAERLNEAIQLNVRVQLNHLATHPAVARRSSRGDLFLHGWVYDFRTGEVYIDASTEHQATGGKHAFNPLFPGEDNPLPGQASIEAEKIRR